MASLELAVMVSPPLLLLLLLSSLLVASMSLEIKPASESKIIFLIQHREHEGVRQPPGQLAGASGRVKEAPGPGAGASLRGTAGATGRTHLPPAAPAPARRARPAAGSTLCVTSSPGPAPGPPAPAKVSTPQQTGDDVLLQMEGGGPAPAETTSEVLQLCPALITVN